MTGTEITTFIGGLLLVWTLGWCGGAMVQRIRRAMDHF